jgi:hypothetical protein
MDGKMDLKPPEGSNISVASDASAPTIVIPPARGYMRYPTGLFMLLWLSGWAFGEKFAITQILSGKYDLFIVFWLAVWTLGGIFAVNFLYRTFRPAVPETLELRRTGIAYDSGIAPPQFNNYRRSGNPINAWRSAFPKRVRLELDRSQLQSLRLRETDTGNRLTFDSGASRIEIAPTASEVEREWLARLLARRYSLPQIVSGSNPVGDS